MEENSENKPKEPKAKPKAKASGRKLQSKKGKEAQPALTSIIGNGEQPDREQGNQEITEVEASSENLNEDADNEALQLNITEDQSLSPPSHTIMRPKRPKEENLNRLRKLIKKLEDLEPRTTGPYFENEDDPELEPGNNDEAELETDEDQEDNEAYEDHERQTAAELFLKGGTERFRSLSSRDEKEVRMALCCMFYLRAELTLRRTSEFLIFLLGEARLRLEEDLEEGERLASMHGKVQQTAIVLVEKLRENDQEMLWCTKAGVCILVQFQLGDARLFFARPSLQQIMLDMWQGVRPDHFERNWCQQLRVWMRLLLFGSANLVMVPLFAVAPGVESYLQCKVILRADQTRQEEEDRWKRILKKQNNQWPYRFEKKGKVCWDKEDFEKAVREECREQVFQVQSRMPLLIPRYKKYLAILTNLGFAAYLIAERPEGANVPVVLVLSAGAWLGEVAQLVSFANAKAGARNSFLFWFMDRVNVMELVAFTCIAWTTVLVLIDKQSVEFAQQFKALGVLFLGISQFMAMLRMSSVFGPLVSMTMNMIVDMIQWVALLFPMIACVVAALVTLFKTRSKSCVPFGFDYLKGVVRFFEAQIGGEMLQDSLECLRGAESPAQFTGPLIMMLGMWMIMILMLNMLIAMMAKTFDRIYESAMVDFQYHFIGNLLQMIEEPAVPPILRTLGVPWRICSTCWWWIYQRGSKLSEKIGTTQKAQQKVKLRESSFHDMQKELQEREDKEADILKAMKLRFLDKNLTHEDCIKMLYAFVTEFISEHASDTQVQDDLWRKQMAQKLFLMDIKLETKVDTLRTQLDEMSKNMKSIEQSLQKLTGNSADSSLQSKPDVEGVQKDTTSWG